MNQCWTNQPCTSKSSNATQDVKTSRVHFVATPDTCDLVGKYKADISDGGLVSSTASNISISTSLKPAARMLPPVSLATRQWKKHHHGHFRNVCSTPTNVPRFCSRTCSKKKNLPPFTFKFTHERQMNTHGKCGAFLTIKFVITDVFCVITRHFTEVFTSILAAFVCTQQHAHTVPIVLHKHLTVAKANYIY
jgi:hypothetical protein